MTLTNSKTVLMTDNMLSETRFWPQITLSLFRRNKKSDTLHSS